MEWGFIEGLRGRGVMWDSWIARRCGLLSYLLHLFFVLSEQERNCQFPFSVSDQDLDFVFTFSTPFSIL